MNKIDITDKKRHTLLSPSISACHLLSEARNIYLNKDCSRMFCNMSSLATIGGYDRLNWNYVENIYRVYDGDFSLRLDGYITDKMTNISKAYRLCSNMTNGDFTINNQITDISGVFEECSNLVADINIFNNLSPTNISHSFTNCYKITGNTLNSENIINMSYAYYGTNRLPITCGENTTNMSYCYANYKYVGDSVAVCGNNVIDMSGAYFNCQSLTGSPVCGNNVINMSNSYYYCKNLMGNLICGNNVVNMSHTYYNCWNLIGDPACSDNVINMSCTYENCHNITGQPACSNNVIDMYYAYYNCSNLTGSPICGDNVTNMNGTYFRCSNLTGQPVCGDNVIDMSGAYAHCINLTGNPVCGNKVIDMAYAFNWCVKLTGPPVCGPNVINMRGAYSRCRNITGNPACGNNVIDMYEAYANCTDLYGNMWMNYIGSRNSDDVNAVICFCDRNSQNRLNIYVKKNYAWDNWLYNVGTLGASDTKYTWTTMDGGYYNSAYNTYVYCIYCNISDLQLSGPSKILLKNGQVQYTTNLEDIAQSQRSVTWSCSGPATIDQNGLLTLTSEAKEGDIITITLTSNYDTSIVRTLQTNILDKGYIIDLNDGQWLDSGTTVNNCTVYESAKGSYYINSGLSRATITINGYTSFTVMIRSYAESYYDYVVIGNLDQTGLTRTISTYKARTRGAQSASTYTTVSYTNIDGGTHTIEIIYAKDSSGNSNDDRGYFYIPEQ